MTTVPVLESFLEIEDPVIISDNLKFINYIDYIPSDDSLNAGGEVRITMRDIDGFCLLQKSKSIITLYVKQNVPEDTGNALFEAGD